MNLSEVELAKLRAQYITQIIEILDAAKFAGLDIDSILADASVIAQMPNR